jgi:hypothetical protein
MHHSPLEVARSWIGQWVEPGLLRTAIKACGFLGDSTALAWLSEQMVNPELNRIAAEAVFLITGQQLPQGLPLVQSEQEDTNLEDDNLPWADINRHAEALPATMDLTTNLNAQIKNQHIKPPFLAMRYHRYAQWLIN